MKEWAWANSKKHSAPWNGLRRSTAKSAGDVVKLARALEKAAKLGNIPAIKREQARLGEALNTLRQGVANAVDAWPFQDDEEERYLRDGYFAEVCAAASSKGLKTFVRGETLIAHPLSFAPCPAPGKSRLTKRPPQT